MIYDSAILLRANLQAIRMQVNGNIPRFPQGVPEGLGKVCWETKAPKLIGTHFCRFETGNHTGGPMRQCQAGVVCIWTQITIFVRAYGVGIQILLVDRSPAVRYVGPSFEIYVIERSASSSPNPSGATKSSLPIQIQPAMFIRIHHLSFVEILCPSLPPSSTALVNV